MKLETSWSSSVLNTNRHFTLAFVRSEPIEFVVFAAVWASATSGKPFRVITVAVDQSVTFPFSRCFFTCSTASIVDRLRVY